MPIFRGSRQRNWIAPAALADLNNGRCPACSYRGYVLGPRGGLSINIECGNVQCRARYNVAQAPGSHRFIFGHTIEREADGGADWTTTR